MDLDDFLQSVWTRFTEFAVQPISRFFGGLQHDDRNVFFVLLVVAIAIGVLIGRYLSSRGARASEFQNSGEARVSRVLHSNFGPPDYHLMNHLTLQMEDGTTQIDHILVSRFGVL